jgi:hypothetical protein
MNLIFTFINFYYLLVYHIFIIIDVVFFNFLHELRYIIIYQELVIVYLSPWFLTSHKGNDDYKCVVCLNNTNVTAANQANIIR